MNIRVNGEDHRVPDGLSVQGLVEHLGLTEGPVAVEKNRVVVPRDDHAKTVVSDGDEIEIVHFVGGG